MQMEDRETEKPFNHIGVAACLPLFLSRCETFMCFSFSFQLDSYEIKINFHVLSFASQAVDIVDILDSQISGDTESVIGYLMDFDYNSKTLLVTP